MHTPTIYRSWPIFKQFAYEKIETAHIMGTHEFAYLYSVRSQRMAMRADDKLQIAPRFQSDGIAQSVAQGLNAEWLEQAGACANGACRGPGPR